MKIAEEIFPIPTPFNRETQIYFFIIGTGGTGSYLIEDLSRYISLEMAKENRFALQPRIILIDKDRVEEKNLIRQKFVLSDVGKYKAEVLAKRYSNLFGIPIYYYPEYFNANLFHEISIRIDKADFEQNHRSSSFKSIVLGCVDNNEARLEIAEAINQWDAQSVVNPLWIDCGNERDNGQTILTIPGATPYLIQYPGFIINKEDLSPEHRSCVEEAIENPQTILANRLSALQAMGMLTNMIRYCKVESIKTEFSINPLTVRSELLTGTKLDQLEKIRRGSNVKSLITNFRQKLKIGRTSTVVSTI